MGEEAEKLEELETSEETMEETGELTEADSETRISADGSEEALKETDETKTPATVPYDRFKEVNEKAKAKEQIETKFEHFKRLGPEGYYKLYPDEKPEETSTETEDIDDIAEMENLVVTGGKYDGKTINEVLEIDKVVGTKMMYDYLRDKEKQVEEQRAAKTKALQDSEAEIVQFAKALHKESGAEADLGQDEISKILKGEGKIGQTIQQTLDWMEKTNRGFGNILDGYLLMTMNDRLQGKAEGTLKSIVDALKSDTPSIPAKQTGTNMETGYNRFLSMSPAQVANALENMSEAENLEFLKKAPESVRKKFPAFPWD